jgi:hypothetical protein
LHAEEQRGLVTDQRQGDVAIGGALHRAPGREFDLDTFKRGYEEWDIDALLALYAKLSSSRSTATTRRALRASDREGDVQGHVLNTAPGPGSRRAWRIWSQAPERVAATVTCEFPGGRKVVANGIVALEDGRIVRELQVLSDDPK